MIQKLQNGGTANLFYLDNPYISQAPIMTQSTRSSKDEGLISEDLIQKLSEKGIPVDVDNLLSQIGELEYQQSLGVPISSRTVRKLEAQINRVVQQADYLQVAEERAMKNESFGEIAVGDRGELFVFTDKGDIKKVAINQYDINKHGAALTVNELIEQRKFNPTQAYDSSITTAIGNNVGMSKIVEYIQKIITSVGSSETVQEAYIDLASILGKELAKKPSKEQLAAIQQLHKMSKTMGMDAIFKEKEIIKSKNIQAALTYINSILPRNMQIQLQSRFVANGMPLSKSSEGVAMLIGNALLSANEVKQTYGIEYDASINKAAGTQAGLASSSEAQYSQTPLEVFFNGNLNQKWITLTDPSAQNQYALDVKGNTYGQLVNLQGQTIAMKPLSVALDMSIGQFLDYSKVYMGDSKITASELDNIAYTRSDIAQVFLPVTISGDIDWKGMKGFSAAENEIKTRGTNNLSIDQKNLIHEKHGSYMRYTKDGQLEAVRTTAAFFRTRGYTIDDRLPKDITMAAELKGGEEDQIAEQINGIYSKALKKAYGISGIAGQQKWDDIFEVPIFIKISPTASSDVAIAAKHGPKQKYYSEADYMAQQQINNGETLITDSSILYNYE